jgi:hypothetical protein
MKKILALLFIIALVTLSGCEDKEAQEYAAKLIPVLDSYQEQLSQKIKVEQDSYEDLAQTYEEARTADIDIRLRNERKRRSVDIGERFSNAKDAPTLSQIFTSLQEYAKLDFETTQAVLQEGLNARSQYLINLEGVEIELQKIKTFKEALKELAKPKSDFKKFKSATDFLIKTDDGISKLLCADLKKRITELETDSASATGDEKKEEKKKIEQKIKQAKERIATKKCS